MDQNIDFSSWAGKSGEWKKEEKNDALFVYLKQEGIETYYDNLYVVTHSKAIVIDEELVYKLIFSKLYPVRNFVLFSGSFGISNGVYLTLSF